MNYCKKEGFILTNMNLFFCKGFMMIGCLFFLITFGSLQPLAAQQTKTISGTVTEKSGEPLIGVSISIKGTITGTISDINGNFTIQQVPVNAVLVASFIGFATQEINIGASNVYNFTMEEDDKLLDEIVVVGYGVQSKATLSGSVAVISADEITTTKSDNLVTNLQGKMPGLLIRQQSGEPGVFDNMMSIRGNGTPLVVIDGVRRDRDGINDLAQLNPEDVESISILKDASAAIYGMNAANGVIVVTTKKGEDGVAKISYSGLYGIKMPTGMELTMDAYSYRVLANEMERNIGIMAPKYEDGILEKYRLGIDGHQDWDWIDMYMRRWVPQHNHTVTVRGGSGKVKYFTSLGYTEDNGLFASKIQKYQRYNFRTNLTAELTKNLSLNVSVAGRWDQNMRGREDFIWTYKTLMVNDRGVGPYTYWNPELLSDIDPEHKNAAALTNPDIEGYRLNRNMNTQTQAEFKYTAPFLKGLDFTLLGAFDTRTGNVSDLQRQYNLYNYWTLSDSPSATKNVDQYTNTLHLWQKSYVRFMANYNTKWKSHNLNLMGAVEAEGTRRDELMGRRQYADAYTQDIIDMGTSTTASNSGRREYTRLAAYFGRLNYDYDGKYLLEGVLRYNGSYRYAPSKRWVLFPSFSAGWRLSEEDFMKNLAPFVDNLKLRASYGESGRDAGDAFQYVAGYSANAGRGTVFDGSSLTAAMIPPGLITDKLSWINTIMTNFGVDFDMWNGKLGGSIEYFQMKNTGILTDSRLNQPPNTFGATLGRENLNSDMSMGFDLGLTHKGKIEDFKYSVGANLTFSRVKRLHEERGPFSSSWDRWRNGQENRFTGRSLIYTYDGRYTSLDQYETAPLMGGSSGNSRSLPGSLRIDDNNGDGRINSDDQLYQNWAFGNTGYRAGDNSPSQRVNPPLQFGFNMGAEYKNFDLNLLFQGAALYSIHYSMDDIWGYGRFPTLHKKFEDRWHTVNITDDPYNPATQWIEGYYPALRANRDGTPDNWVTDVWRPKATYLRMKNVELGYTLPRAALRAIGLERARIFVNGNNLLTFCRRELKDADPERQENEFNANLAYPIMKAVNFGININF